MWVKTRLYSAPPVSYSGRLERGIELLSRAQFAFGFLGPTQSSQGSAQLMMRRGVFRLPCDDAAKLRRRRLPIFDLHRRIAQCVAGFNETRGQLDGDPKFGHRFKPLPLALERHPQLMMRGSVSMIQFQDSPERFCHLDRIC